MPFSCGGADCRPSSKAGMRLRRRLRRRTAVQSRLFCRPARSASRSACSARALGVAIERLVVRPLWDRGATMFVMILATLAAQIVIERATLIAVGDRPKTLPEFTDLPPIKIGAIAIGYQLASIVAT